MRRTTVDPLTGSVVCPKCGARDSFTSKRTGRAKLLGVVTVGVGVVAMPKRLKCNGCGTNLKRGKSKHPLFMRTPIPAHHGHSAPSDRNPGKWYA